MVSGLTRERTAPENRHDSTLYSPLAGLGVAIDGTFLPSLWWKFDHYQSGFKTNEGRFPALTLPIVLRKLIIDVYGRETSIIKKIQEDNLTSAKGSSSCEASSDDEGDPIAKRARER